VYKGSLPWSDKRVADSHRQRRGSPRLAASRRAWQHPRLHRSSGRTRHPAAPCKASPGLHSGLHSLPVRTSLRLQGGPAGPLAPPPRRPSPTLPLALTAPAGQRRAAGAEPDNRGAAEAKMSVTTWSSCTGDGSRSAIVRVGQDPSRAPSASAPHRREATEPVPSAARERVCAAVSPAVIPATAEQRGQISRTCPVITVLDGGYRRADQNTYPVQARAPASAR